MLRFPHPSFKKKTQFQSEKTLDTSFTTSLPVPDLTEIDGKASLSKEPLSKSPLRVVHWLTQLANVIHSFRSYDMSSSKVSDLRKDDAKRFSQLPRFIRWLKHLANLIPSFASFEIPSSYDRKSREDVSKRLRCPATASELADRLRAEPTSPWLLDLKSDNEILQSFCYLALPFDFFEIPYWPQNTETRSSNSFEIDSLIAIDRFRPDPDLCHPSPGISKLGESVVDDEFSQLRAK